MNIEELIPAFSFFIAIQGFLLAAILAFSKRYNKKSNQLLALFMVIISIIILRDYFEKVNFIQQFQVLYILTWGLPVLVGPLLYMYVNNLTFREKYTFYNIHMILPVLYFLFLIYGIIAGIASETEIQKHPISFGMYILFQLSVIIQLGLYLFWSFKKVNKYRRQLKNNFSDVDKKNLYWLTYLLGTIIVIYVLWLLLSGGDMLIIKHKIPDYTVNIIILLFTICIFSIGYFALLLPELFIPEKLENDHDEPKQSTSNPSINSSILDDLKIKLLDILEKEKVYLNPSLTIKDLSEQMHSNTKVISQLINSGFNQSFYDLINTYRIEEVKNNIINNQNHHLTLEGIAFNSGFKSSSTFNRLFKKYTGQTPKQFRKGYQ